MFVKWNVYMKIHMFELGFCKRSSFLLGFNFSLAAASLVEKMSRDKMENKLYGKHRW